MRTKNRKLKLSAISYALMCAGFVMPVHSAEVTEKQTTDVGVVKISGEGDDLGNGLMIEDDGVKARSTVTKAAIEKALPSGNAYQLLNLMPGVNAYSYDATGLYGGGLRVRGFNSDQMGFTVNGAPVNDSGNFAVYPQEYTELENLCEIFVTQGSADTEAPHAGASGGNVGLVSCAPKDEFGGKVSQSLGQLGFTKTFVRLDSGKLGENHPLKFFISFSHAETDKFKGSGQANRDHVDAGVDFKITDDTTFSGDLIYNKAINNNIATLTKVQFANNPNLDYSTVIPQHTGANDSTNFSTSTTPTKLNTYYGYSVNPFENLLLTGKLESKINQHLTLSAEPYFWYGYGTGGTQQSTLNISSSGLSGGISNPYGDASTVVGVYSSNVTQTYRPGITFKAKYDLEDHKILAGLWIERADHEQTKPATTVDNNGNVASTWLDSNLVTYNNGSLYQGRNYKTITTASSLFASDTITINKQLDIVPGLRYLKVNRDFTNYASSNSGYGADYTTSADYDRLLPSFGVSYKINDAFQLYGNIAQNMKAPSNYVLTGWVSSSVTYTNGVASTYTLTPRRVTEETSINSEGGFRYFGEQFNTSIALFNVDFKNRIAQGYNPETGSYTDYNVGDVNIRGIEFQGGSKPINGWSVFTSVTYTDSKIENDFNTVLGGNQATLATNGKSFVDTPKWMMGAKLQYASGPFMAGLSTKYTGKRYTTLMNDEFLDGYTTVDFDAGYRFPSTGVFKDPTIRLNVSNLFNEKYLLANNGSGSSISATTNTAYSGGSSPSYYVGAPRFFGVTLSADY
jgi:iron complex outermembrane recepter protein